MPVVVAYCREIIAVIALVVRGVVVRERKGTATKEGTDSDDPDAIIGHDLFIFGMIVEVLQFALLGEVMNSSTAFANGWEGAEVFDHLLSR